MYNLASALIFNEGTWHDASVSNTLLKELHVNNSAIVLNVFETISQHEMHLNLKHPTMLQKTLYSNLTVGEFLQQNGDTVLPAVSGYKKLTSIKRHYYLDKATDIGKLRGEPTILGYEYSVDRPLSKAIDLELKAKPSAFKNSIATCGGFLHLIKETSRGSCVMNGTDTMNRTKDYSYGVHDFSELGSIKQFSLTTEMIKDSDNGFIVNLGEDITDKLVLLSIQGSLFFESVNYSPFTKVGKQTIALNKNKVPWLQLIFQTQRFMDMSFLNLLRVPSGDSSVAVEQLNDSDMHRAMLLGPNSFAIILTPDDINQPIATEISYLHDSGLRSGIYMAGDYAPAGIMLNNYNQVCNYVNQVNYDGSMCKVNRYELANYVFETTNWKEMLNIDDSRLMSHFRGQVCSMRNLNFYQLK